MRWMIGFLLGVLLLGGCAVYPEPLPPAAGLYVAPPPAGWSSRRPALGMGLDGLGRWMASPVALMAQE